MNTLTIKNLVIGEGVPKVIVSLMGKDIATLKTEAQTYLNADFDILEWRADHFMDVGSAQSVLNALGHLRQIMGDIPLLFTFRSAQEGGEHALSVEEYTALNLAVIESGLADIIDIELYTGDKHVENLVARAHEKGVYVVMSNHDFHQTPTADEIVHRLRRMQALGADIPKIAVMPQSKRDVLTLLTATLDMHEKYADRPIITMSMAKTGVISRLAGEVFGSAATFGAVKKASAPGQVSVNDLRAILTLLH